MRKLISLMLLIVVILTAIGCSGKPGTNTPELANQQEPAVPSPDPTPEVVTPNVPDVTTTPAPTEPEPEPENPLNNEPIAQNYHMTSNYYIKPNDENDNKKVVLLTFDDGPKEEKMLTDLLDILDKHNAKAIFFVNGYRIKQNPELLTLIHNRGQIIGNHAWDHINLKKENAEKIDQQISDVQTIVKELTGELPVFFRPPFGAANDEVRAKVKEAGMLFMTWSNGSLDWADNVRKPQGVIDSVMEQLAPGSNILMHEVAWTVEALDALLTKIEEQGYSFIDPRVIELEAR